MPHLELHELLLVLVLGKHLILDPLHHFSVQVSQSLVPLLHLLGVIRLSGLPGLVYFDLSLIIRGWQHRLDWFLLARFLESPDLRDAQGVVSMGS